MEEEKGITMANKKEEETVTIEMMGATEPIEITEKKNSNVQRTGMGRVYVAPKDMDEDKNESGEEK